MEMPLWLAKGLYERKRHVISVELPKVYREGWRTVFGADANMVDLHKMGPYYYGLGSQMLHFDSPENLEIAQSVLQVSTCLRGAASVLQGSRTPVLRGWCPHGKPDYITVS